VSAERPSAVGASKPEPHPELLKEFFERVGANWSFDPLRDPKWQPSREDYEALRDGARERLDVLVGRLEQKDKALRHYADEAHWTDVTPGPETNTAGYESFEYDGGQRFPWTVAREALGVPPPGGPDS
jgi:hypothetical protein